MESVSERWLSVKGYEGLYEVSDQGMVRSLHRYEASRFLKPKRSGKRKNYLAVGLNRDGIRKEFNIHRLVMQAFVGDRPEGMHINHKNGITTDNRLCNLEYVTPQQNVDHSLEMGLHPSQARGNPSKLRILSDDDVRAIRRMSTGFSKAEISRRFGCSEKTIRHVLTGAYYSDVQ